MAIPRVNSTKNITRFPNGVTNVSKYSTLGGMAGMDPTRQITFFDDFIANPDITAATPNGWTFTTTNSGTLTGATTLAGGVLVSTTGATSTNFNYVQTKEVMIIPKNVAAQGMFMKFAWNAPRVNGSTTHDQDIILGLMVITTTPLAANTEGISYQVANGASTGVVKISNGTSTTTSATVNTNTYTAGVYTSIGLWLDPYGIDDNGGSGCLKIFVNDVQQPIKMPLTNIGTNPLAVTMGNVTHSANAGIMNVDYFFAAQERLTNIPL